MERVADVFADCGLLRHPARRRAGDEPRRPNIPKLTIDENRELQQLLQQRGYDVGRIDGVLGLKSRSAVREIQIKLGMPADSWPTPELLQRLRGGDVIAREAGLTSLRMLACLARCS